LTQIYKRSLNKFILPECSPFQKNQTSSWTHTEKISVALPSISKVALKFVSVKGKTFPKIMKLFWTMSAKPQVWNSETNLLIIIFPIKVCQILHYSTLNLSLRTNVQQTNYKILKCFNSYLNISKGLNRQSRSPKNLY
jgi:hypothetical protein